MILLCVFIVFQLKRSWTQHKYQKFQGKTKQQLKAYLGLKDEFYKEPLLKLLQNRLGGEDENFPQEFDWRKQMPQCVHQVRDQGKCGSCYAHSASEFFSDRFCIKSQGEINVVFSPQQIVDCKFLNYGCQGGYLTTTLIYYILFGAVEENCYGPYESGKTQKESWKCFLTDWNCQAYKADWSSINIMTNPQQIKKEIINNGPVNGGYLVYRDFFDYKEGIYRRKSNELMGGHAVKIIGWGKETNSNSEETEFWIVQNSWGQDWGENGYFRIAFGECGIDAFATSVEPKLD